MRAFAAVRLWSVVTLTAGLVSAGGPARAEEGQPPSAAVSSEQLQEARRELAVGLAERAQKMEGDWPSATGSVPRRTAPAPVVEALSGQGLDRLLFDMSPLGRPHGLTPPSERKQDTETADTDIPLPPPVPGIASPSAELPASGSSSQKPSPVSPRVRTSAVSQERLRERPVTAKAAPKAEWRSPPRKKAVRVAFYRKQGTARRIRSVRWAPPLSALGVVGAAGQGIGYVGRRIGFALTCLGHVRCRTTRQVAGTAVGAVAGGALGGAGGGVAGGIIGAVATAPRR
jgi:hypothetical protein